MLDHPLSFSHHLTPYFRLTRASEAQAQAPNEPKAFGSWYLGTRGGKTGKFWDPDPDPV